MSAPGVADERSPERRLRRAIPRAYTAAWTAAITFAVLSRTIALGRWPGLNGDEAWYGVNIHEILNGGTPFLHTGVGNPLNPLHSGVLLVASALLPPSVALLRVPEVIFGMIAVLIAWPLLRGPLGQRAALLSAILIAISPAAIVYSRLGWDPSGSPLVTLLAIGCALHDRPVLAALTLVAAYLVHPTNVFVAPMVAAAWAPHAIVRYHRTSPRDRARLIAATIAVTIVAIPIVAWLMSRVADNPQTALPSISMVVERALSPAMWTTRAWGAISLMSGITSAVYVGGPMPAAAAFAANAATAILLIVMLAIGLPLMRTRTHAPWLLAGIVMTFAGFHIVAITPALDPGLERYALFMLIPLLVVTAVAIDAAMDRAAPAARAAAIAMIAVMIAVIGGGYFYPLAVRGGDSAATYRTGAVEPKLAAFHFIERDSRDNGPVSIIAEDWWLYWSLRYFAGGTDRIDVVAAAPESIPGGLRPKGAIAPPQRTPSITYIVAFAGSGFPATVTRSAVAFQAVDPIGRPIVEVFRIDRSLSSHR